MGILENVLKHWVMWLTLMISLMKWTAFLYSCFGGGLYKKHLICHRNYKSMKPASSKHILFKTLYRECYVTLFMEIILH